MRTKKYPSDTSREQFEIIKLLLEGARKKTKPRTVDLYEVRQMPLVWPAIRRQRHRQLLQPTSRRRYAAPVGRLQV